MAQQALAKGPFRAVAEDHAVTEEQAMDWDLLEQRFGPGIRSLARRRLVAGARGGMAAGQFPVSDVSVSLGTVRGTGVTPGALGARTSVPPRPGIRRPAPASAPAGSAAGPGRVVPELVTVRRRPGPRAEVPRSRARGLRLWAVPVVLAVVCAILTGAAHLLQGTPKHPAAAVAPAAPVAPTPATPLPVAPTPSQPPAAPPAPVAPGEPDPTGATPAPTPAPAPPGAGTREIVLRWGDTLWRLAQRHRTTVEALQELNGLGHSTLIHAGATLRVPATDDGATTDAPAAADDGAAAEETGADPQPATTPATDGPEPTDTTTPADGADGAGAGAAVAHARAQLGKPYVWGATGPDAFDCSGLVVRAWQTAGLTLPRTTWDMRHAGTATTRQALVPGDLVITNGGAHVQLYVGDGQVVHAPGRNRPVTTAPLPPADRITAYRHPTA